jgi:acyl-CoA thioesterase YciA
MVSPPELPQILPLVRLIAMPARRLTQKGDIFGGWLLSQMDLAGGSLAAQRARARCATVAVDGMVFHQPVFVGDEVSCYGESVWTGRTSMTVRIEAWRRHPPSDDVRKVTGAVSTYVAIARPAARAPFLRRTGPAATVGRQGIKPAGRSAVSNNRSCRRP